MMKNFFAWLLLPLLLVVGTGCGSDKDRGINKEKDRPKAGKLTDKD